MHSAVIRLKTVFQIKSGYFFFVECKYIDRKISMIRAVIEHPPQLDILNYITSLSVKNDQSQFGENLVC